ncbi:MAG: hypothetical protein EYC70_00305 [Planctomycetota bacterium]|nr:MAG: hypothetical protein EYC70_00305 [Planctomycetota bacterium]
MSELRPRCVQIPGPAGAQASVQQAARAALMPLAEAGCRERFRAGQLAWHICRGEEWRDLGGRRTRAAARELALCYACLYGQPVYLADLLALPFPVVAVIRPIAPVRVERAA